jgi:hypothetical protein
VVVAGRHALKSIVGGAPGEPEAEFATPAPDRAGKTQEGGLAAGGWTKEVEAAALHPEWLKKRTSKGQREGKDQPVVPVC